MIPCLLPRLFAVIIAAATAGAQTAPSPAPPPAKATLTIGLRKIAVPPPAGFVRTDGISRDFDNAMKNFFPATNRLLAYYASPEDHAAVTGGTSSSHSRTFNLQVVRSIENEEIGERTFAGVREQMKDEFEKMRSKISADIKKLVADGNEQVNKDYGVDSALSVSDTAFLGFFEDSDSSLGFTMALKTQQKADDGTVVESKSIAAGIMAPVNGRLINFYANAPYTSEADRNAAEKAVAAWRDATVAANPRVAGPEAEEGLAYRIGKMAGIGAVIGLLFGLVKLFTKKKSTAAAR